MMSPHIFNINGIPSQQSNPPRVCLIATQNSCAKSTLGQQSPIQPTYNVATKCSYDPKGLKAHTWMNLLTFSIVRCVCIQYGKCDHVGKRQKPGDMRGIKCTHCTLPGLLRVESGNCIKLTAASLHSNGLVKYPAIQTRWLLHPSPDYCSWLYFTA